jgi:hypothetical protein
MGENNGSEYNGNYLLNNAVRELASRPSFGLADKPDGAKLELRVSSWKIPGVDISMEAMLGLPRKNQTYTVKVIDHGKAIVPDAPAKTYVYELIPCFSTDKEGDYARRFSYREDLQVYLELVVLGGNGSGEKAPTIESEDASGEQGFTVESEEVITMEGPNEPKRKKPKRNPRAGGKTSNTIRRKKTDK